MSKRSLLSTEDLHDDELTNLLELAERIKRRGPRDLLKGKTLGLLFRDRSLRTRVSFDVAMFQLGGMTVPLGAHDLYGIEAMPEAVMDGDADEHVKEAAMTLSLYLDAIGIRAATRGTTWAQDREDTLLRHYFDHATVPVINLQSHMHHPCQALADIQTMRSKVHSLKGRRLTLAWTQNPEAQSLGTPHSLVLAATRMGMNVTVAHPQGFELDPEVMQLARDHAQSHGGALEIAHDLEDPARESDFIYARSWRSIKCYEDPDRERLLKRSLDHWQITQDILNVGQSSWLLQPLPVRRNVAVSDDALDGERSLVSLQAENRLHTQKALLVHLLA